MGGAGFGGGVFFEEVADFEVEVWKVGGAAEPEILEQKGINGKSRLVNLVLLPLWYGNKDIIRDNISKCHR